LWLFKVKTQKMNRQAEADFLAYEDDEYVNGLATDWYFLDMFFNNAVPSVAQLIVDPLIEVGLRLKRCLRDGGHTYLTPRNVCADEDLYFDIWLDADGDIRAGDLYMDEREDFEL
jgi:hypothetical protein